MEPRPFVGKQLHAMKIVGFIENTLISTPLFQTDYHML